MLQAQNGRQINLAAEVVRKFLTSNQVDIKHSEALQLVSQLIGYPNYHAARAGLQGVAKGVASNTSTWRQLAHAIGTLSDEQLDMPVQVTEGCDENGNATFAKACELVVANSGCIAAAGGIFADIQPVLLIEELEAQSADDSTDVDQDEAAEEDEYRVGMQLECATGQPCSLAGWHIARDGIDEAIKYLNSEYDCNISLGKYIAYSTAENGYWNADFGFVGDKASATGFDSHEAVLSLAITPALVPVLYSEAEDIDDRDD